MWLYRYENGDSTRLPEQEIIDDLAGAHQAADGTSQPLADAATAAEQSDESRGLAEWIAPLLSRLASARSH